MRLILVIALLTLPPAAALAHGVYVPLSDLNIVSRPQVEPYRPDGNLDLSDSGKAFSMVCTIDGAGHLSNCYAEANTLNDQNFVRHGLNDVGQWVVAPSLRDGQPAAGRQVRITCRFDQVPPELPEGAQKLASN